MLRGLDKRGVTERILGQLLGAILDKTLQPGERLPSERSLASRLGVNRTSLREALKRLEQLGLVKTRQGDGTRVLDFMSTAGLELLQHLIARSAADNPRLLSDLLEVRHVLGRELAKLAAVRALPEDLAALRQTQAEALACAGAPRALLQADIQFFQTIGKATQNRVVQLLTNSIRASVALQPDIFEGIMPAAQVTLDYHAQIIAALAAKDADVAGALTETYLGEMARRLR